MNGSTDTTLAARIARATLAVGGILKADKRNDFNRYDYISADQVSAIAGQALAAEQVFLVPSITSTDLQTQPGTGGKPMYIAILGMAITIKSPNDEYSVPWSGMGVDSQSPDKAYAKAITTAVKYFTLRLLSIGAGNPDGEHEDHGTGNGAGNGAGKQNGNSNGANKPQAPANKPQAPANKPQAPANKQAPASNGANKTQAPASTSADGWNSEWAQPSHYAAAKAWGTALIGESACNELWMETFRAKIAAKAENAAMFLDAWHHIVTEHMAEAQAA